MSNLRKTPAQKHIAGLSGNSAHKNWINSRWAKNKKVAMKNIAMQNMSNIKIKFLKWKVKTFNSVHEIVQKNQEKSFCKSYRKHLTKTKKIRSDYMNCVHSFLITNW